jgi:hypothetical protein
MLDKEVTAIVRSKPERNKEVRNVQPDEVISTNSLSLI